MNFAKQLSQGLSHQVDMLNLENTMGVDGLNEVDAEAIENDSAEDPNLVAESIRAIEDTAATTDLVDEAAEQLHAADDAEVTLESISASLEKAIKQGGLSVIGATFAQNTLASVSTRMNMPKSFGRAIVPDLQSFSGASDALASTEVTMLGVKDALVGIGEFIFATTANITTALHSWSMKCNKAVEALAQRSQELHQKWSVDLNHKTNKATGQNLSATDANISLAQKLYVGPHDNRVEGIFKRMELLDKTLRDYLHSGIDSLDAVSESISRTAGTLGDEYIDGSLINSIHAIASKVAHTQQQLSGEVIHTTPELFEGKAFGIRLDKAQQQYTLSEFKQASRSLQIGMFEVNPQQKATKQTWHNYVLKGANSDEVANLLKIVDSTISTLRLYAQSAAKQTAMGKKLASEGKAGLKAFKSTRAARSALYAAIMIWREGCSGGHELVEHALEVCHNILTYVGKSISAINWYLNLLEDDASARRRGPIARIGGALVGGGVGAYLARGAKNPYVTAGTVITGSTIGYHGADTLYSASKTIRRKQWDRAAKKHQAENHQSSTH